MLLHLNDPTIALWHSNDSIWYRMLDQPRSLTDPASNLPEQHFDVSEFPIALLDVSPLEFVFLPLSEFPSNCLDHSLLAAVLVAHSTVPLGIFSFAVSFSLLLGVAVLVVVSTRQPFFLLPRASCVRLLLSVLLPHDVSALPPLWHRVLC